MLQEKRNRVLIHVFFSFLFSLHYPYPTILSLSHSPIDTIPPRLPFHPHFSFPLMPISHHSHLSLTFDPPRQHRPPSPYYNSISSSSSSFCISSGQLGIGVSHDEIPLLFFLDGRSPVIVFFLNLATMISGGSMTRARVGRAGFWAWVGGFVRHVDHLPHLALEIYAISTANPNRTISRKAFKSIHSFISEPDSRAQVGALEDNVKEFGLTYFGMGDRRQGIVHIIGPEQGFTLPGTTVVCGDSHTSSRWGYWV